jgi:hypothetical protein
MEVLLQKAFFSRDHHQRNAGSGWDEHYQKPEIV